MAVNARMEDGEGAHRPPRPRGFPPLDFEAVTPAQWGAARGENAALQPEKRLMLAVLTDAIELVLRDGSALDARRAILRRRAAEWIGSSDCGWAFSFVNICEALGFEPERLRTRIAGASSNESVRTEADRGVGADVPSRRADAAAVDGERGDRRNETA